MLAILKSNGKEYEGKRFSEMSEEEINNSVSNALGSWSPNAVFLEPLSWGDGDTKTWQWCDEDDEIVILSEKWTKNSL